MANPPQTVKIEEIAINEPSRIVGVMPANLNWNEYNLEIRTQFTKGHLLKDSRTTTSRFVIEHL